MSGDAEQPRLEDTGFEPIDRSRFDPEHVARVAACLDVDPAPVFAAGTLPILWHWAFFPPTEPTAGLGPDGHPRRRPEMAPFPRRMFGAGRVRVHTPLRIGEPAERTSTLAGAALKEGGSGRFWVATVTQTIEQHGVACLEEEKDFLLRAIGPTPAPGPDEDDAPEAEWVESLVPDPAFLFRFSAVTYNAHRIHYDRPYATGVEGYPNLVVHGPLTAVLLASMAERRSGRRARALSFRASAPLFVEQTLWLTGGPTADGVSMAAVRSDHAVAMTMDLELSD